MNNKKNLLGSRDTYSKYYGDFRGVDFSSDHSQVIDQRLAYSVNMYKDYQSGQGQAIETIPGFRQRYALWGKINGIHYLKQSEGKASLLVHTGEKLYEVPMQNDTINVPLETSIQLVEKGDDKNFYVEFPAAAVTGVYLNGNDILDDYATFEDGQLKLTGCNKGDWITVEYMEGIKDKSSSIATMENIKSTSFVFNNFLYLLDGSKFRRYKGQDTKVVDVDNDEPYVPTTYINIVPGGENANAGTKYEERNLLTAAFKNTFIPDGNSKVYKLSEKGLDDIISVSVDGKEVEKGTDYSASAVDGVVVFIDGHIPHKREYAAVEIVAKTSYDTQNKNLIKKCTIASTFDDRVFLAGNPDTPNTVYWCGRNATTGVIDPTYFPITNYVQAGVEYAPITGFVPIGDTLMVLKSDTLQDGAVYYLNGIETGNDIVPKIYKATRGLSGVGCVGACVNFLDDPVFLSRLGLEGISKLEIASERSIQHRSSLIDAKLTNFTVEQLKSAVVEEWNGYLVLLIDGKIFMADSRQRYADATGVAQYEWYYLEGIGVYNKQYDEYVFDEHIPEKIKGKKIGDYDIAIMDGAAYQTANPNGEEVTHYYFPAEKVLVYYIVKGEKAYLCHRSGRKIGGEFKKATTLKVIDGNLYFGTENGIICSFNFDKRNEYGEIPNEYYTFDGRTIFCGAATKMDNCGIPHLAKSTVKKSTVIKTRSFASSAIKVMVRTNKKPYEQIARINTNTLDFDNIDFNDFSFITEGETIFAVKEKEKQWVEKQYYVFSDEFRKPFSINYISYRYVVSGRVKT